MNIKLDGWNGLSMGWVDLKHLLRPTQDYQDITVFALNGRQPRARYIIQLMMWQRYLTMMELPIN